ncbi:MAG: 50S ribosomal protein L25/general stress protein Ctc [Aquabacterium sp.]|jgi:large subunit ribosomal protein L25|uniref:50S ribosomal protein L25/general stress protein Ctc n=1 Tax=Aquabacterium sp. TaxID=1872578 RepID=UPI002A36A814|nr:50S ribosomal protein L25/general stress protein Ctc [Aquabacterium sp.]MDX9844526.1 50S ribosomal protein L25/general stress protein Ctc [Aquabacterium sp.]
MKFTAFERNLQGTGASRRLRNNGKTPGIVYGAGQEPKNIELDHNALYHAMRKEAFHSSILEMELNGKVEKVLLRDYQKHPFKQLVLHVDFQRIDATTKIHKKVPLHFINEEQSQAVKVDKCIINHAVTELEIECLAEQLPEFLTVDLANVVKGQTIHVNDLVLDKHIKVRTHGHKNPLIATVVEPVEEVIAAPVAAAEPAKGKKGKK